MHDLLTVLPMAFVMVAGPQIVSAILLATGTRPRRDSAFFLLGAAAATTLGVGVAYALTGLVRTRGVHWSIGPGVERGIDLTIIGLLLLLALKVFLDRNSGKPPRWMSELQTATPFFALRLGFLLFLLLPGDLFSMFTVGAFLAHHLQAWWGCLVFVLITVGLAGIPLLALLLLGESAKRRLPAMRDWMTANSWIVSELVIGFFLAMILKSLK